MNPQGLSTAGAIRDHSFSLKGGRTGVLLIHGLTGTPVEMRYLGRGLHKAGYTVHGVQLPGHCGTEDDLAATTWLDWQAGVSRALEELSKRVDQVFVGGLSMGAVMALHTAALHPDKVAGVMCYGTTFWYDGWNIPWYSILWKPLINTPIGRNYRFMERPPYGIKNERLRKIVADNMLSGNSADAGLAGMPACSMVHFWKLAAQVKRELHQIKVPALVVHAVEDDVSSVRNARYLQKQLRGPVELKLLDDSYHMITVDQQRAEVVSLSIDYLQRYATVQEPVQEPAREQMQEQSAAA